MSKPSSRGTPSERVKSLPTDKPRVFDTYLRALEKLAAIAPEVQALEEEVADREVELLGRILALMTPVVDRLAKPVVLHEPWLDESETTGPGRPLREPGLVLLRSFKQERDESGASVHKSQGLVLARGGRLLEFEETARWTEPHHQQAVWRVESWPVEVTPAFARSRLPSILAAILDALRESLATEVDNKRELKERLLRLAEAERALG